MKISRESSSLPGDLPRRRREMMLMIALGWMRNFSRVAREWRVVRGQRLMRSREGG